VVSKRACCVNWHRNVPSGAVRVKVEANPGLEAKPKMSPGRPVRNKKGKVKESVVKDPDKYMNCIINKNSRVLEERCYHRYCFEVYAPPLLILCVSSFNTKLYSYYFRKPRRLVQRTIKESFVAVRRSTRNYKSKV
jgi:hypothetical protein